MIDRLLQRGFVEGIDDTKVILTGKGEEAPKADFCKLITTDSEIGKSFVFEKNDFKLAEIVHDLIIEKIIMPEGEKDFAKIREMSKRQGKIIRKAIIDGAKSEKTYEFVA